MQGRADISQVKDALGKISKHLEPHMFYKDFPFYIILAYRIHMWVMHCCKSDRVLKYFMILQTDEHVPVWWEPAFHNVLCQHDGDCCTSWYFQNPPQISEVHIQTSLFTAFSLWIKLWMWSLSLFRARDFTIMFDDSNRGNVGVFLLLELACIDLCKVSFTNRQNHHIQKKPPSNELYDRFIYNTLVWGMYFYTMYIDVFAPM